MRLLSGILLAFVFSISGAGAAGYDDFADGMSALMRGDNDRAIAGFTAALAAGDLNANLVPTAYFDRARALLGKGNCAAALSDLNATLKLKPDYPEASFFRASADECAGDHAAAILDLTQAIALKPTVNSYLGRGTMRWMQNDFSGAASDFAYAAKLNPNYAYSALWHAVTQMRIGAFDANKFAVEASKLDDDAWPEPIVDLYLGKSTPEDVANAANEGDAKVVPGQRCEANFYTAEWWLAHQNVTSAKPLLENAQVNCPHNFREYSAADVELKRLK